MSIIQKSTKEACANAAKLYARDFKENYLTLFDSKWFLMFLALLSTFIWAEMCDITLLKRAVPSTDEAVFRYVGYAMAEGQIPYVDVFDHKGPLLFLFNYIGYCIRHHVGLWVVEYVMLLIMTCYLYKTAKLFCTKNIQAVGAVALSLSLLNRYFHGGNCTESFAMTFIAVAVYIFLDYFTTNRTTLWKLLVCGFCGGCVLMLRPNLAATWLVFPAAALVNEILRKNAKILWKYIPVFVLGVVIAVLPFILYFAWVGGLYDFYECYILFNMLYTAAEGSAQGLANCIVYFTTPLIILSGFILVHQITQKKNVLLNITFIAYGIISLIAISLSGRTSGHYGLALICIPIYPMSILMTMYKKEEFCKFATAALLTVVFVFSWLVPVLDAGNHLLNGPVVYKDRFLNQIVNFVTAHTDYHDEIIVTGNRHQVYFYSERLAASKHSYQIPNTNIYPKFRDEFYEDLNEDPPAMVIIYNGQQLPDLIYEWVEEHNYQQVFSNVSYIAYMPAETAAPILLENGGPIYQQ